MSVLSQDIQERVEKKLIETKLISKSVAEKLKAKAKANQTPFMQLLVTDGGISTEELTKIVAKITNVPYVNLSKARIDSDILALLPQETAETYMAVPLGEMDHRLVVAMLDADNVQAIDFLANKIGRPLKVYAASEEGIKRVLRQYGSKLDQSVANELQRDSDAESETLTEIVGAKTQSEMESVVQDSPITKVLTAILEYAANNRASDIHIEPSQKAIRIRARIDGVLREIMRLPKSTEAPLVSRVKILSSLKIDEHRVPQDGQFSVTISKREIDLRVAISPVVWGEQVIIRVLDKTGTSLKLEDMGYMGRTLKTIRQSLGHSNGMILTSGPTGSGKSTSMYALIQELKNDKVNIVTLEDPVEYKIDGVNQIQVNNEVGLTFASGLRSILRQDPNIIMVGEIRDKETANLAVQASLTGHLVFSTLHTNSAAGILPRLLDMGIEPFLIASTVRTVIGQRLVRRINTDKESYKASLSEQSAIRNELDSILTDDPEKSKKLAIELGYKSLPLRRQSAYTLFKGKESDEAPDGYRGRMGLFEAFNVNEEIQQLIIKHATSAEIQRSAQAQGMLTMRQDGYLKALAGYTTLDEVNRVAGLDSA